MTVVRREDKTRVEIGRAMAAALESLPESTSNDQKMVTLWQILMEKEPPGACYDVWECLRAWNSHCHAERLDRWNSVLHKINDKVTLLAAEVEGLRSENASLRERLRFPAQSDCRFCRDIPPAGFACNMCGRTSP